MRHRSYKLTSFTYTFLLVLVLASSCYAQGLESVDVETAKWLTKGLARMEQIAPAVACLAIFYFIITSFFQRAFSKDRSIPQWIVTAVVILMLQSVFFGAPVLTALRITHKVNSAPIQRVITDTYPGDGATESSIPTGSGTKFEVLASAFDTNDESLAAGVGDNLAMIQTVTAEEHTRWSLDMSSVTPSGASNQSGSFLTWINDVFASSALDPGATSQSTSAKVQQELYDNVAAYNNEEASNGILGGGLLYLYNAASSVAGGVGAMFDGKQLAKAATGEEATGGVDPTSHAYRSDDTFAASNLNLATTSSAPVTVVTMATYPGGVQEYGRHALAFISEPDKNYHAGTIPAAEIISTIDASKQAPGSISARDLTLPSPTSQGPGTVYDYAKQNGFNGEEEGVYPQFYLRAHGELQSSECGAAAAGYRPNSNGSADIFNPIGNIPALPIQANTTQLTGAVQDIFGQLSGLTPGSGNLLSQLITSLQSNDKMYSKLSNYKPSFTGASNAPQDSVAAITAQYDQLITDSTTNGMSHATNCLKNGKAMLSVASAISKASGANDKIYHQWLDDVSGGSAARAEAQSTLAWSVGKDVDTDILARKVDDSNEASSIAGIVQKVAGMIGTFTPSSGAVSMQTKLPTTQETSWKRPDQKLEAHIREGRARREGDTNADGSQKSFWQKGKDAVLGSLQEGLAAYAQIILRFWTILLAGIPFIALLTQVAILTTVATFSYSLGMSILPIWEILMLGKLFNQKSAGDDDYNGFSSIPLLTIIIGTTVLGAEIAAAKACQGQVQYYLTHVVDLTAAQIESVLRAVGVILFNNGTLSSASWKQTFMPMMEAIKPIGICTACAIGPALIARLLTPGIIAHSASAAHASGMASNASQGGAGHIASGIKSAATAYATGGASVAAEAGGKAGKSGESGNKSGDPAKR